MQRNRARMILAAGLGLGLVMMSVAQPPAATPETMPSGSQSNSPGMKNAPQPKYPTKVLDKGPSEWAKDILDRDPGVSEAAIKMMLVFGPEGRRYGAKNLIVSLNKSDANCRAAAASVIGAFSGFDEPALQREAVSRLTSAMGDPQVVVRLAAVNAISAIGPPATNSAIPVMCARLTDEPNYEIRRAAAVALGRCAQSEKGPPERRAIVALAKGLNDSSALVRRDCVQSLIVLGPPTEPADAALLKSMITKNALSDRDKLVSLWSRVCLMRMDPTAINDANFEVIFQSLRGTEAEMCLQGAHAVGVIGSLASKAVPDLIKLLDHKEPQVAATAAWSLGQMGTAGNPALAKLQTLTTSKDEDLAKIAKQAIEDIRNPKKDP
ncbi:HEAT repeat domain-containing protein [Tuwongella immobilis]|uniref:HEAT repeat domain-containing protein n=1 Tax=Tuwongella immobilis TaxID=692036 RepID=A0A6C2YU75_9BACT|nr:HEAT repeat domain-containing protein [Tuwongella immobilis]VIP04599.1 heat repeat-containing protein : PBS lyase HEAT-like repeat domain protein OS=Coleofasciculus chthonoplastes PCC 7420 GN=MC7420_6677 PE=4 SV=1: HEAT_2: HEAT_2 [Tuwongella immobilis]VTS06559.1 heat repeat-containing protein : PBS lyase HEAT-like repeat domain protein OS=Coleofasciculus chthonoplastes PCC 7420 GN=MC7420_6677 PE=4 SV=1: HEAT_2: HEAT_2 [Tuwongella immobilis]